MNIPATLRDIYEKTFSPDASYALYWWLGLIGILLVLFIVWRFKRARRNFRVFRDESGVAETTDHALRDLVRIACSGVDTASKPKIRFVKKHGRINVQIRAKLHQGQRLSVVRDQLRRSVTSTFQDTHGILVGDVSFLVTGFKNDPHTAPTTEPEPASAEVVPAVGPAPVVTPEPVKEPELAQPAAFGWSNPESEATTSDEEPGSTDEPEEAVEEKPKKKGGFFGFGRKKPEPDVTEEVSVEEESKKQDEALPEDDFPLLPDDFDEGLEKKPGDDKKV